MLDDKIDNIDSGAFGPERLQPKRPPLSLWEWQANQMENYMLYLIDHHGFKPKYYCPHNSENPICILPHYISRLYD